MKLLNRKMKNMEETKTFLSEQAKEEFANMRQTAQALSKLSRSIYEVTGKPPTIKMLLDVYKAKDRIKAGERVLNWCATGSPNLVARLDKELVDVFLAKLREPMALLYYNGPLLTEEYYHIDENGSVTLSPEVLPTVNAKHTVTLSERARKMLMWAEDYVRVFNSDPGSGWFRNTRSWPNICTLSNGKLSASPELAAEYYN